MEQYPGVLNYKGLQPYQPLRLNISLTEAVKHSMWLRQLLIDLKVDQDAIPINCDN